MPSDTLLDELGVDMDTFRMLTRMQSREINENDYDLLMRLHTKPNTQTLDEKTIAAVSVNYIAASPEATDTSDAGDAGQTFDEDTCSVCLCSMSAGEELSRLKCEGRHVFHRKCIGAHATRPNACGLRATCV